MEMTAREEFMEMQRFTEEHHDLLLKFMRRYRLSDDFYGPLAERYVKTARTYVQREDLHQYAFSTILWYRLSAELIKIKRRSAKAPQSYSYDNLLVKPGKCDDHSADLLWYEIEQRVTEQQLDMLRMRALGFTNAEIAKKQNCSPGTISKRIGRIKALLKQHGVI